MDEEKYPQIYYIDAGGCNGCYMELLAALESRYGAKQFGVKPAELPEHTDILVISGPVTRNSWERVEQLIEDTPEPNKIMVLGSCGISEGAFQGSYNIVGPIDELIDVDLFVPGCPVKPQAIIDGIKQLTEELKNESTKTF